MWRLSGWPTGRSGTESFLKVGEVRSALAYQSMLNRFFVGRTDVFTLPAGQEAVVSLSNPSGSRRRSFIQAMSVTSNLGRRSVFWFDLVTPVSLRRSDKVANAHRGASNLPKSVIAYGFASSVQLRGGVDVFERLLVGKQTLLLDQEGKYILEPGHNHSVYFPALDREDEIDVAVAWWEEPLR